MGRWPKDRCDDWMAQATSYSQDPEDIALICKSERYGFCIESSDRIPNGYDASFRYDAILFLSLSLSLSGWQDFARDGISNGGTLHLTRSPRKKWSKFRETKGASDTRVRSRSEILSSESIWRMAIGWSAPSFEARIRSVIGSNGLFKSSLFHSITIFDAANNLHKLGILYTLVGNKV